MFMSPMFMEPHPFVVVLVAAAVVSLVTGLVWIHRITRLDEDARPPVFRYRNEGDVGKGPHAWRPDERGARSTLHVTLPGPIRRRLTVRWWVTRLELTIGATAVAAILVLEVVKPDAMSAGPGQPAWTGLIEPLRLLGPIVGLAWMIRIAYADPEAHRSIWRSKRD